MIDYIKFTVDLDPNCSSPLLFIDFFFNGKFTRRFVSRSFDWFLPMIKDHVPFYIFDNGIQFLDKYYCFDPCCLNTIIALLEEHHADLEEDDGLPF